MSSRPGSTLAVYLAGKMLGELERRGPARYRFAYSGQALEKYPEGDIALSASLPVGRDPFAPARAAPFFEGLLPEGAVRASIAHSFRLSEQDGFGLLAQLGADCAGAVELLRPDAHPGTRVGWLRSLKSSELVRLVEDLPTHPLGIDSSSDGVRLSLGGVQHKLVLADSNTIGFAGGEIFTPFSQPLDGAPSTCLLKPELGQYEDIVANEAFCMSIARSVGLRVAETEVLEVASTPCLYVRRFDRIGKELGMVTRVHQEDMCQALGLLPAAKYEENGGPSVAGIVDLLRRLRGPFMARDINDFIHAVLVNFLLGNSDAHGKNFALLYESRGIRLAPLYDIVSTTAYDDVTDRMAMAIGGVFEPAEVDMAAWVRLGNECGLGGGIFTMVRKRTARVLKRVEARRNALESSGGHRPVVDVIVDVCRRRAAQLGA
jgi:serine/threonine-protein kinase HipA